jgi:hypothetical protein
MASAKDMVALNLAHKCDDLELRLKPLKDCPNDSVLVLGIGSESDIPISAHEFVVYHVY